MGNPMCALLWVVLLIFIAWPAALLASGIWIILQPLEACCRCVKDCNNCLEDFIVWPRKVGEAIFNCRASCPQP